MFHRIGVGLVCLAMSPCSLSLETGQWREDLAAVVERIEDKHPAPFTHVSEPDFRRAVAALEQDLASLADAEIIVRLARLVALLGDGHTRLRMPVNPGHMSVIQGHTPDPSPADDDLRFRHLPLQFYLLADGLYITAASPEYRDLIGAKVLRIGEHAAAVALERLRPLLPVENESGFNLLAPAGLAIAEVLVATGLARDPLAISLMLQPMNADEGKEVVLQPLDWDTQVSWIQAPDQMESVPVWLEDPQAYYLLRHMESANAVYLQFNEFNETPGQRAAAVAAQMVELADTTDADRIVIDLRHNFGGDSSYGRPFVLALIRWEKITQPGRLFVLTGRKTFSASIKFYNRLEQYTHMITVGEAMGGTTNAFGDPVRMQLPHSGLTLRVSTVLWRDWTMFQDRETPPPYLPVALTAQAYFSGRDPVLERALTFTGPAPLGERMIAAYTSGGINAALLLYAGITDDPATWATDTGPAMNQLAAHLLAEGNTAYAKALYGFTLRRYPRSVEAYLGLADVAEAEGKPGEARDALEKALHIEPGFRAVRDRLKAL